MNVNEQSNLLSREEAWWFIPEEYCPIFLELEKEFNKKIGDPISEQRLSELADILKSKQMKHFYGLADKNESDIAELTKAIITTGDPDQKLGVAKSKAEVRSKRYGGYGEILEELETKVIVNHFVRYFENVGILICDDNKNYSFSKVSNHIANYKVPYTTAQILLEHITRDLEHDSASRVVLLDAIHNLIQDPLFAIVEKKEGKEEALETVYLERFKDGLQILKNNGIVKKKKGVIGHYEFTYEVDYHPSDNKLPNDASRELNEMRRKAAFDELHQIHARFHQTTSTSKEKKAKLRQAYKEIEKKLSEFGIESLDDRIVYHWFQTILLHWYSGTKSTEFIQDIITYIRFNNIRSATIPIEKDKLYKWDYSYPVWNRLLSLIKSTILVEEKKRRVNPKISDALFELPVEISRTDYKNAIHRIMKELSWLIGSDDFFTALDMKALEDANVLERTQQNKQLLSLLYVKATVEANDNHADAISHLEYLYKYICGSSYEHCGKDLNLIVSKLSGFADKDITYPIKAKKWIYKLNHVSQDGDNNANDTTWTLLDIYEVLILLSSDRSHDMDKSRETYATLLSKINPRNYSDRFRLVQSNLFFLETLTDFGPYNEYFKKITYIWDEINDLYDQSKDPRLLCFIIRLFLRGANYLVEYVEFGYSLSIIALKAYLQLRSLHIKDDIIYYQLLNAIGEYLSTFDNFVPTEYQYALKLKMAAGEYLTDKCFLYKSLSGELLDRGYLRLGCEYARKSIELTDIDNLDASNGIADYIASRIQMVEPLLCLGNFDEAKEILDDVRMRATELQGLLNDSEKGGLISNAMDIFNEIEITISRRPYHHYELRLDYLLNEISHLPGFPDELPSDVFGFYDKWKQFVGMYNFYSDRMDESLRNEFESNSFKEEMDNIAKDIHEIVAEVDLEPVTDDDISKLYDIFIDAYENYQGEFICNDTDDDISFLVPEGRNIEYPSMQLFFNFIRFISGNITVH